MDGHEDRARLYHQRSDELKLIASDMADDYCRKLLQRIAADYDRLAVI